METNTTRKAELRIIGISEEIKNICSSIQKLSIGKIDIYKRDEHLIELGIRYKELARASATIAENQLK